MIPSPLELKNRFPLLPHQSDFIQEARQTAAQILQRQDPRLVCIMGPCSIHDPESALEYAGKLKRLALQIDRSIFLVMRLFCEKPRTKIGWKGLLYDPDLDGTNDLAKGLRMTRQLLLSLADLGVPCATEFLEPLAAPYYDDLITWGFIGARTSASQPHRQMASSFSFPVGFKNTLEGELDAPIFGILASQIAHSYLGLDELGRIASLQSSGNPLSHLVLRGSETRPNFDPHSVQKALAALQTHHLEPRLLIDCSHGNSGKNHARQKLAFESLLSQVKQGVEGIAGLMLESHLYEGKQPHSEDPGLLHYGLSITDPCMGWDETEEMLFRADAELSPTWISSVQK